MTDENALKLVIASIAEIRSTPTQYGEVHIIVSGGEVKFVNVTKPPAPVTDQAYNGLPWLDRSQQGAN